MKQRRMVSMLRIKTIAIVPRGEPWYTLNNSILKKMPSSPKAITPVNNKTPNVARDTKSTIPKSLAKPFICSRLSSKIFLILPFTSRAFSLIFSIMKSKNPPFIKSKCQYISILSFTILPPFPQKVKEFVYC